MKVLILGATGATGKALVDLCLAEPSFSSVRVFVRRALERKHEKLEVELIDFDKPETWRDRLEGDVLFSCLGTTLKAAGSQEAQWKVDYDYQYAFAQNARARAVPSYVLISSMGARADARFFYLKMKGQLDEAIQALDFPSAFILRAPALIRPNTARFGEKVSLTILTFLNKLGLFKKFRPLPVASLAEAMLAVLKAHKKGYQVLESTDIWALIEKDASPQPKG